MTTNSDKAKMTLLVAAKASFRAGPRRKTWEQQVQAIARMKVVDRLAKAAMMKSTHRKK